MSQDGSGHLNITAVKSGSGTWTSGRIETTADNFAAPAGGEMEVTASIRQPNPGSGTSGTMTCSNWPYTGEIDIMEDVNALSEVAGTLHRGTDPGGPCNETTGLGSGLVACSGCQTGYNTYSVIVNRTDTSNESITWYLNGTAYKTVTESQVGTTDWQAAVDHGFFIILNNALGGTFPNAICGCTSPSSSTTSGAAMSVGYVAVYQTSGSTATATASASATGTSTGGAQCTTTATSNISADCYGASNGNYLEYKNVNFGTTGSTQFDARVASGAAGGVSGAVEVVLDSPTNAAVATFDVANTGGWSSWETTPANMSKVTGTHNVYLEFASAASGNPAFASLHYFDFPTS